MKRIFLILLILLIILTDAFHCIEVRLRNKKIDIFEAVRLPTCRDLSAARQWLTDIPFIQHVASGDMLKSQPLDLLELVPEDALLLFDTADASAAGKALLASRFGQTVAAIRWPVVLKQLSVPPFFRLLLEQQTAYIKSLLANPLLQDILSRRTVIALLPPEKPSQFRADPMRSLLEQTVLLATPSSEGRIAEFFSLLKATKRQPEVIHHQGVGILVFDLKQGRKLHVAAIGGQTAFSLSLQPVQRSIDLFVRHFVLRQTSLLHSRDYAEMKQQAKGRDDFFFYAELAGLQALLGQQESASVPVAFRSLSLFHQRGGQALQFKAAVRFSPEQLSPLQKEVFTAVPVRNHTVEKMPDSLPLYFWSGWLEPVFLQQALAASGRQESAERMEAWFKTQTGLGLSEILSLFGREFSVNLAEISTSGFFPVPRLGFILEVREQKKAERLLEKMLSGLPVKRDKVAGMPVMSLLAAKGMLQPSCAFADGFLLLADSREQLVDILEGKTERMAKSQAFRATATGMEQPANLMLFARAAELVDGLKELIAWAGTMTAISDDEETGEKSKVLIDQIIMPLLDSLSVCEAVWLRSVLRPGELIIEAAALHTAEDEDAVQAVQTEN